MKLKLLDLFSGIGGFSLGLESTGFFETIGFVEKDKFCQKVLKKYWNNINIEEDIRNVKGERYAADIISGGFPCQPFSVAGKRKSTADDRYLWDEMYYYSSFRHRCMASKKTNLDCCLLQQQWII